MKKPSRDISRRSLLLGAGSLAAAAGISQLTSAKELLMIFDPSRKSDSAEMPALFIGHGSPMNAIEDNQYGQRWFELGKEIGRPKAILCVSAHWLSAGTWVTQMEQPRTIHDFYGFPQALHDMQYPAPGNPELAAELRRLSKNPKIQADEKSWGLDHGTWSVLAKMYPEANIPVIQLSIDMSEPASFHFELGKTLHQLRKQGVLILGSGNIVHNLRRIDWNSPNKGSDWAVEFDEWVKARLEVRDFKSVTEDFGKTLAGQLSVPTPDHYLPLMYVLGAAGDKEEVKWELEGMDMGSLSMRALSFGRKI
nr:4,5-DOPA dioxygenase extradiol [Bdellovibrio bacteriovorus]